jgi:hypothetical protein
MGATADTDATVNGDVMTRRQSSPANQQRGQLQEGIVFVIVPLVLVPQLAAKARSDYQSRCTSIEIGCVQAEKFWII